MGGWWGGVGWWGGGLGVIIEFNLNRVIVGLMLGWVVTIDTNTFFYYMVPITRNRQKAKGKWNRKEYLIIGKPS